MDREDVLAEGHSIWRGRTAAPVGRAERDRDPHGRPRMSEIAGAKRPERKAAIRFIVCLGAVSLFADMTYEGAYSIMGGFLKDLGATAAEVGIIAGLGEMIAASLRYFSGRLPGRTRASLPPLASRGTG